VESANGAATNDVNIVLNSFVSSGTINLDD
jgi:hypothetical protein